MLCVSATRNPQIVGKMQLASLNLCCGFVLIWCLGLFYVFNVHSSSPFFFFVIRFSNCNFRCFKGLMRALVNQNILIKHLVLRFPFTSFKSVYSIICVIQWIYKPLTFNKSFSWNVLLYIFRTNLIIEACSPNLIFVIKTYSLKGSIQVDCINLLDILSLFHLNIHHLTCIIELC